MTTRLGLIVASVRQGRKGEPIARWIHAKLAERPDVSAEWLDLRDWPLPAFAHADSAPTAEKTYAADSLEGRWRDLITSLDGFLVITPEYNHGYPGQLKNALDTLYRPWGYKPVGFVGYGGAAAGARSVEQLRQVAIELRMVPVRSEVNLRLQGLQADERGWPSDEGSQKRAAALLDDVLWWAQVCREGRERHPR